MSSTQELYLLADELRAMAVLGLRFSESEYDRERYEKIMGVAARMVAGLDERDEEEILGKFRDNLFHVSPAIGAEGVVVRDGKILLIRRSDDQLWAVPGGLTEVGETVAESALRELGEECGLKGEITRLLGIYDCRLWGSRIKAHLYHVLFQVDCGGDEPALSSEAIDVGFFAESELPPLSAGHHLRVPFLFKQLRGEEPIPYFDPTGVEKDLEDAAEA